MTSDELNSRIDGWADAHREDILRLTEDLIRFPSENLERTGREKACQLYLAEVMRGMGLDVDMFEPTDVSGLLEHEAYWPGRDYRDRPNVVGVRRGTGGGKSLLFTSHADVVVGLEGQFRPFEPVREENRLYGRGALDMKGGLAASLCAVECLHDLGLRLRGDLIVESVVDEEYGGSNGTLAARLRGYHADAAICPEPNGMIISPAHRGGCLFEITVEGTPGIPFAAAELVNPAYGIAHLAVAIERWEQERNEQGDPPPLYRDAPGLPVVLSTIIATHDLVAVPGRGQLEAWVEVYPGTTYEELRNDFVGYLKSVAASKPVLQKARMDVRRRIRFLPGSQIPADHPIVDLLGDVSARVLGHTAPVRGAGFACDAYVFNLYSSTPCVILGPRGANAHAPDEWVEIEDLIRLTKIYARAALAWCGVQDPA